MRKVEMVGMVGRRSECLSLYGWFCSRMQRQERQEPYKQQNERLEK